MPVNIKENTPLSNYTIYKIGGPARFFVEVKNLGEIKEATEWAQKQNLSFFIIGAGSNVLVSDKGFNGLAIHIAGGEVRVEGEKLMADAGVMMARAVIESAKVGLSGFEWGIGIPGTIGGSVRGNAGCFGHEMKDVVESVKIFDSSKATSHKLQVTGCAFGYRDSVFKKHPEWIILSAILALKKGDAGEIQKKIKEITTERTQKQDIGTKSCGCIFKNVSWTRKDINKEKLLSKLPELEKLKSKPNIPASFLIDSASLKGKKVGKVFVSPKHANYFVNEGGATAEEVVMLIALVKDAVRRKFGILLEEEIQYIGF